MSNWRSFADRAALDQALAEHIAQQLRGDIDKHGQASLAVSGGSTPKQMFQRLSHCALDWPRVVVTLVDERWVTTDSEDSNERLLRENLLQHKAAGARFISLKSPHGDAREGIAEVETRLARLPQPISVIVLGMGGDGHTASWFPQAPNLQDLLDPQGSQVIAASDPVTAPHQRITLTLAAVMNSRDLIVHITGHEKKQVLQNAGRNGLPIAAILEQNTTPATIWWAP